MNPKLGDGEGWGASGIVAKEKVLIRGGAKNPVKGIFKGALDSGEGERNGFFDKSKKTRKSWVPRKKKRAFYKR